MRISASVRSRGARTGTAVAAALAVAGFTLAGAPAAVAAPGDSGDLNVQSTDSSRGKHQRNGAPTVCEFRLVATNFETLPVVPWTITEQPPAVPPNTLAGSLPLAQGTARSQEYQLPDGTYLLTWIVPAGPKTKTFEVDCSREDRNGERRGENQNGSSWSGSEKSGSDKWGGEKEYTKPSGAVPAGGGGVPTMENVGSESDSNLGTTAALAAGAAGVAGLIMVRRAARHRVRGEA